MARARGGRPPKHTSKQVATALRACGGNCSRTAKRLGLDPETLRRRLQREPALAAIRDEASEALLDDAEDAVVKLVRNPKHSGHVQAVLGVLKLRGAARGWRTSIDATVDQKGVPMLVHYDATTDSGLAEAKRRADAAFRRQAPGAVRGKTFFFPRKDPLPGGEPPEDAEPTAEPVDDVRQDELDDNEGSDE